MIKNYVSGHNICANKVVENHMRMIKDMMCSEVRGIKGITLIGSYGWGEGSMFINDGFACPINDYDIYALREEKIDELRIYDLQEKLNALLRHSLSNESERIGIDQDTNIDNLIRDFKVDVRFVNKRRLRTAPCMQRFYEIKKGSRCIWGEDIADYLPDYDAKDIPLGDGLRLIVNEASHLLEAGNIDGIDDHIYRRRIIYFLSKAELSILKMFMIERGMLQCPYSECLRAFKREYAANTSAYERIIPGSVRRFEDALKRKLGFIDIDMKDVPMLWDTVVNDINRALKWLMKKIIPIRYDNDWMMIADDMVKADWSGYFSPYVKDIVEKGIGLALPERFSALYGYPGIWYLKKRYSSHISRIRGHRLKIKGKNEPGIYIMAALPLVLLSMRIERQNGAFIKKGNELLNEINPSICKTPHWDDLRKNYVDSYRLYFWQRGIV